jgi:hypothetical protein
VIVGSGAGSVIVGSGTGRLGSPLGGGGVGDGVVGAVVLDTGAGVLVAVAVGEPLADGEPPAAVDLLGLGAAAVAARSSATPEPVERAAARAADGDGRYSPREDPSPPARP